MNKTLMEWLQYTTGLLVDNPALITIEWEGETSTYVLRYPPKPGLLIGQNGEIAAGIRRILKAMAKSLDTGIVYVEIRTS